MTSKQRHGSRSISRDPLAFERDSLSLTFDEFALDGDDEFFELDGDSDIVSVTEWEGEWRTLTLRGTLTIEDDLTERVFPEGERENPPGNLVLAVDCKPTHLREGHDIEVDDFTDGTETIELTVSSDTHYESFAVTPQLVRTDPGPESSNYRTTRGLALADGEPVTVEIDEVEEGGDRLLPSYFKSFGNSERFPDDAVYVVDKSDHDRPKLFVNSDHEAIRDALNSGPRGYVGHVMMVYRDLIFLPALSELVLWTAKDVNEEGSTAHDWQEALLQQIGTRMFDTTSDATEAGERLYEEFHEEPAITGLLDRTSQTLQDYLDVEESMNSLVDTLRK